jgi:hypothetical protein
MYYSLALFIFIGLFLVKKINKKFVLWKTIKAHF